MVINFHGDKIFVDFIKFFIHKVLNICSTWFLAYQLVNVVINLFSLFKFIVLSYAYVDFLESMYIHSMTYVPYNITVFCRTELRLKVYLL